MTISEILYQTDVELQRAITNWKRAQTRDRNEQRKGLTDGSVRQTRRMANAVTALSRAHFRYENALRDRNRAVKASN